MEFQFVIPNRKTTVQKVGKISVEMGKTEEKAHSGVFSHSHGVESEQKYSSHTLGITNKQSWRSFFCRSDRRYAQKS